MYTYTHTHPFNGPLSGTTHVSRYQKGKTNLDFTGARDSEWQWHQLGHMQICTSLQTDNHASTSLLVFLQAGCPSCRPTNSVKALKAQYVYIIQSYCSTCANTNKKLCNYKINIRQPRIADGTLYTVQRCSNISVVCISSAPKSAVI